MPRTEPRPQTKVNMSKTTIGYAIAAVAAATYGLNPFFALPCYAGGMNADSVLFFRYLMAIVIVGAMLRARGHNFRVERRQILPLMAMGVLLAVSSLSLFESYNYMSSGIASTLLFVYPVMVAVIMAVVFRERLSWITAASIAVSLAGIGLLYRGDGSATLSFVGTMLVMLSSLSYAIYIVCVNRRPLATMPSLKLTFWALTSGLLVFGCRFAAQVPMTLPDNATLWLNLVGLAVFPTAVSFLCTTRAIQLIGSTPTAILGALEPLTAAVIGVIVFGEVLTHRDVAGIVLILVAVSAVVANDSLSGVIVRLRKMFPRVIRHKK